MPTAKTAARSFCTVKEMTYIALFTVLITLCSWISLPTAIPVTLQTFAVFAAIGLLGGKRAFFSIFVYLLLGAIGVPVFAGFTGGLGILLSFTGGYMIGFLLTAVANMGITRLFGDSIPVQIVSMIIGLLLCYAFGTVWYMQVYVDQIGSIGLGTALATCVLPFVIPDLLKLVGAVLLTRRLQAYVKL